MQKIISILGVIASVLFAVTPQFSDIQPKTAAWLSLIGTVATAVGGALHRYGANNIYLTVVGVLVAALSVLAGAGDLLPANVVFVLSVAGTAVAALGKSLFNIGNDKDDNDVIGSTLRGLLLLAVVGLSSWAVVGCARVKGAETAVYTAQTLAAWQGVQAVVVVLDNNDVVQVGAFYQTHDRVTTSIESLLNRLEAGGYNQKDVLVLLDQIAADIGQMEDDLQLIRDPGSKEKFSQILFSVRFGLNSIRAVVAATQQPDAKPLLTARSSRPTTRAFWWNDVMAVVTNVYIHTTYQSRMDAPTAWADGRAIIQAIREINKAKLGA